MLDGLREALGVDQLGDAEVEELGLSRRRDEDVGRLDVAVHDQAAVRVLHRVAQLGEQPEAPLERLPDNYKVLSIKLPCDEGNPDVGFVAFTGYDAGFAADYQTLTFKVKGLPGDELEIRFFGSPETSIIINLGTYHGAVDLGNGWYQVSVPMSDFPTAATNDGFLLGPLGAQAAPFTYLMTDIGFSGSAGADPGITPEAVAYSSDPAVAEDFGPPGGIQNFGSGAVFVDVLDDPDFAKVLETTSGEGYGAGVHVGFAAFTGYAAGFAAGYETLHFKVKGDAANLAAFEVKFFAAPREALGTDEILLDIPAGSTVKDLINTLRDMYPVLESYTRFLSVAVNRAYVGRQTELQDGDVVACLPPVGGG